MLRGVQLFTVYLSIPVNGEAETPSTGSRCLGDAQQLYAAARGCAFALASGHTVAFARLQENQLPTVTDGRLSGGPLNVAAFLEMPDVQEQVGPPPPQHPDSFL